MKRLRSPSRRGLTLIESLIASAILLMSVLALTTAIAAGQSAAIEGQKLLLGSLAVDDLLSELWSEDYDDLSKYDGAEEAVGALATLDGEDYPDTYWMIGRRVEVEDTDIKAEAVGVIVRGKLLRVTVFDEDRDLVSAELFVPEPAGGG
ncbi:MAG: type IV pilus modification PilV family protein [Phycisphaerales bacterium]